MDLVKLSRTSWLTLGAVAAGALFAFLWPRVQDGWGHIPDYAPGTDPDSVFSAAVIPVLRSQCEDCHFPGGPLHQELPFDDQTVVHQLEGELLTRLEGRGRERVQAWFDLVYRTRAQQAESENRP